eukprot:TRINITY_DN47401_c0_g1_i1.p1 TRINITY_DN47401_c0_g1~~TRINITY_DN47401_c0_g1_i1.p1  ORF type:complete len:226 (-),score=42.84 TRINITY_DN47401_c0_g1_i1:159-836(-)
MSWEKLAVILAIAIVTLQVEARRTRNTNTTSLKHDGPSDDDLGSDEPSAYVDLGGGFCVLAEHGRRPPSKTKYEESQGACEAACSAAEGCTGYNWLREGACMKYLVGPLALDPEGHFATSTRCMVKAEHVGKLEEVQAPTRKATSDSLSSLDSDSDSDSQKAMEAENAGKLEETQVSTPRQSDIETTDDPQKAVGALKSSGGRSFPSSTLFGLVACATSAMFLFI